MRHFSQDFLTQILKLPYEIHDLSQDFLTQILKPPYAIRDLSQGFLTQALKLPQEMCHESRLNSNPEASL